MTVRTRFAPSPTGFLHVGGARTALYSWLYAKHHQGQFILRIEDTDRERSTQESVQAILDGMAWLGLMHDEGPFYQTDRYKRYQEVSARLLSEGKAYRCTCSKERLETLREAQMKAKEKPRYDGHCRDKNQGEMSEPHVIRFKNPVEGSVVFNDEVYGTIEVKNSELDDLILVRSDGHPTYNYAVVIDDWDMQITHVIRGDDHISNTPRQINLYEALEAPVPVFAHLPMILGDDGKRLSKRHGAISVMQFRDMGFLPEALLNYLVRLGWSHGDMEIFSIKEMIQFFNLNDVSRGVSTFNYDKLNWLNQHYQKSLPQERVSAELKWQFESHQIDWTNGPSLESLVSLQAERFKTLDELCIQSAYFYQDEILYNEEAVKKHLRPVVLLPMKALYERFDALDQWEALFIQSAIDSVCQQFDIGMGKVAQPLRVAVTGSSNSPAIDATLVLLGKMRTLSRMRDALVKIEERAINLA